jgi:hypothetical protein
MDFIILIPIEIIIVPILIAIYFIYQLCKTGIGLIKDDLKGGK